MAKQELVTIKTHDSENGKIFVMSRDISGLSLYERAKAIEHFINKDTKVLEMALENHLRQILIDNGVIPKDGSQQSLERAFLQLEGKGKNINIIDRYYELENERIIGESPNHMTIINENDILSCAMEIYIENV